MKHHAQHTSIDMFTISPEINLSIGKLILSALLTQIHSKVSHNSQETKITESSSGVSFIREPQWQLVSIYST